LHICLIKATLLRRVALEPSSDGGGDDYSFLGSFASGAVNISLQSPKLPRRPHLPHDELFPLCSLDLLRAVDDKVVRIRGEGETSVLRDDLDLFSV
jgi:hypothetical protein